MNPELCSLQDAFCLNAFRPGTQFPTVSTVLIFSAITCFPHLCYLLLHRKNSRCHLCILSFKFPSFHFDKIEVCCSSKSYIMLYGNSLLGGSCHSCTSMDLVQLMWLSCSFGLKNALCSPLSLSPTWPSEHPWDPRSIRHLPWCLSSSPQPPLTAGESL